MQGTGSVSLTKGKLFGIISAATIGILLVPMIIPHSTHSMLPHLLLHLMAVVMAVFLVSIATISYRRIHSTRLLLTVLAFVALACVESLYLVNTSLMVENLMILGSDIEIPHILGLVMLVMFSLGVLKVN